MSGIIRWEDPPPDKFRWKRAAAELRESPGRWACVLEKGDKGQASNCWRAMTGHGCEVTTRSMGPRFSVWARWPESGSLTS